jgi:hypothetical protein
MRPVTACMVTRLHVAVLLISLSTCHQSLALAPQQAFCLAVDSLSCSVAGLQTGMPMTALSVLGGQFRLKAQTRAELYQDFLPWALRAGFRSADLICLYYEKHFEVGQLAHC